MWELKVYKTLPLLPFLSWRLQLQHQDRRADHLASLFEMRLYCEYPQTPLQRCVLINSFLDVEITAALKMIRI